MSWLVVARKDFEDAVRSRMLWVITAVFLLFSVGAVYVRKAILGDAPGLPDATQFLTSPASLIIPLTALVVAYLAIAGERESGSIKILLGLPHTRADVVLGKLVGRTLVVTVGIFVAFAGAAITLLALFGELAVVDFLLLTLLTVLFGLTYVGIAIGASSFAATRSRAMALAVGAFFLFQVLWNLVPLGVYYLVEGGLPTGASATPAWYYLLQVLNPNNAYSQAADLVFSGAGPIVPAEALAGSSVPFYVQNWFGLVVLVGWLVVPVLLGYWRFERADLG
ncbi:ABC transporter permease subunit [Halorussus sp. MSC15.2]|uniref:ABC transporter permease subunit n=1 Tax=Halorussus sp. MSC15.2 TaxID=2283638 RepID=UPI0013CFD434|nr:ABC transporter permease subunit [Halorussus sp. MSC15.2]NEU57731.1 ABC transporter permease [Halorussus sp. MSC15.2]